MNDDPTMNLRYIPRHGKLVLQQQWKKAWSNEYYWRDVAIESPIITKDSYGVSVGEGEKIKEDE